MLWHTVKFTLMLDYTWLFVLYMQNITGQKALNYPLLHVLTLSHNLKPLLSVSMREEISLCLSPPLPSYVSHSILLLLSLWLMGQSQMFMTDEMGEGSDVIQILSVSLVELVLPPYLQGCRTLRTLYSRRGLWWWWVLEGMGPKESHRNRNQKKL